MYECSQAVVWYIKGRRVGRGCGVGIDIMCGCSKAIVWCCVFVLQAIRLSNTAMGQTTTGQIVNLMSNDVNRFDQVHFARVTLGGGGVFFT